jgi:Fur family ferric uptake transcriptional regulator
VEKQEVYEYLRRAGLRMTSLKKAVVDLFLGGSCGISARDVLSSLGSIHDLSTVYRCLQTLAEKGFLRYSIGPEGVMQYRCTSLFYPDHGHFSCVCCGGTIHVNRILPEKFLKLVEEEYSVKIDSADYLLEGKCRECRS